MIALMLLSLALLIYGMAISAIGHARAHSMAQQRVSAARATDRQQWASLDY